MNNPLHNLSSSNLRELIKALRAGWLTLPITSLSVQNYSNTSPAETAAELQHLIDEGTSPTQLAYFLDLLLNERERTHPIDDFIDLVWTGPEASGVTNLDTGVAVRDLFRNATDSVLISGYAIYQGKEVFKTLAEQMDKLPDLNVQMFLDVQRKWRDTTKSSEILREFAHTFKSKDWPGKRLPDVYYDPRSLELNSKQRSSLHAKCVVIDRSVAFLSSANFTEAAQTRNIEAGVLIRSHHFAQKLAHHFLALVDIEALKPIARI